MSIIATQSNRRTIQLFSSLRGQRVLSRRLVRRKRSPCCHLISLWAFSAPLSAYSCRVKIARQSFICQAAASNASHRFQKSLAVIVLTIVEPKCLLVKITKQMKRFNTDVCALKTTLEQAPKILQSIRVDVAANIFPRMVNRFVDVIRI